MGKHEALTSSDSTEDSFRILAKFHHANCFHNVEVEVEVKASQRKKPKLSFRLSMKRLAATYSRGIYKTTTIGKTVFDGRVRNGIGSDHSFMATKKSIKERLVL